MKKNNFVLTVKFKSGKTSELFNLNGLKEMTIQQAIDESYKMVRRKILENGNFSKCHFNVWKGAMPHSIRYDLIDTNGFFKGRQTHNF